MFSFFVNNITGMLFNTNTKFDWSTSLDSWVFREIGMLHVEMFWGSYWKKILYQCINSSRKSTRKKETIFYIFLYLKTIVMIVRVSTQSNKHSHPWKFKPSNIGWAIVLLDINRSTAEHWGIDYRDNFNKLYVLSGKGIL